MVNVGIYTIHGSYGFIVNTDVGSDVATFWHNEKKTNQRLLKLALPRKESNHRQLSRGHTIAQHLATVGRISLRGVIWTIMIP